MEKQDVIRTFEQAIAEVEASALEHYVVAFCVDATPLRTDGKQIAIYGERVFSCNDKAKARVVARTINEQLGETGGTVQIERATAWRSRRIAVLRDLIGQLEAA